jgi:hypothetical protein
MVKISEKIKEAQAKNEPFISFEYYPPRTAEGVANLYKRFARMAQQGAWARSRAGMDWRVMDNSCSVYAAWYHCRRGKGCRPALPLRHTTSRRGGPARVHLRHSRSAAAR